MASDAHTFSTPPILGVRTRVRGYTVAQALEESMPGTREVLAADAAGACVVLRVPEDERTAHRMKAEATLAQRHLSSAIVQSVGLLEHDSWPVQVLEHVDGMRLDTLALMSGAMPPEAACRVGWKVGVALAELHGKKPVMAHGALSSERVIVDVQGHTRLRDLGRLHPDQPERLMSPERREVLGGPSAPDDLFALGLIVAECALGYPLDLDGGHLDPKVLDGLLPERLIDALAALLAPEETRLSNAAAAVRVLVELEYALADGEAALKKAVERARLGMAFGGLAHGDETDDGEDTLHTHQTIPDARDHAETMSADARAKDFAEEDPTIPSDPAIPAFVEAAKQKQKQKAKPAAEVPLPKAVLNDKPAPKKLAKTTDKIERVKAKSTSAEAPVKQQGSSSMGLVMGLTTGFLAYIATPIAIAMLAFSAIGGFMDSMTKGDPMAKLDAQMPSGSVDAAAPSAEDTAAALAALTALANADKNDAKMPALVALNDVKPAKADDFAMPSLPSLPSMPSFDFHLPSLPSFDVASIEKMLGVGDAKPAMIATGDDALPPDAAKAAADLQAALNAAMAAGALEDAKAAHEVARAAPAHVDAAAPHFVVSGSMKPAPTAKKIATPAPAAKHEPVVVEKKHVEAAKAKPSALSFDDAAPAPRHEEAKPVEEAKPLPKVKLVAGVDGGLRALAEAGVRGCRVSNGTVGVIHPNGSKSVTTEPKNACAEHALAKSLASFKGSDEPLELDLE